MNTKSCFVPQYLPGAALPFRGPKWKTRVLDEREYYYHVVDTCIKRQCSQQAGNHWPGSNLSKLFLIFQYSVSFITSGSYTKRV